MNNPTDPSPPDPQVLDYAAPPPRLGFWGWWQLFMRISRGRPSGSAISYGDSKNPASAPVLVEYASPRTEPAIPASQIVTEFLGGVVLLVMAVIFLAGAVFNLRIASWIWAVLYLIVGLAFAWGGGVEIQRGIRHQRRR